MFELLADTKAHAGTRISIASNASNEIEAYRGSRCNLVLTLDDRGSVTKI